MYYFGSEKDVDAKCNECDYVSDVPHNLAKNPHKAKLYTGAFIYFPPKHNGQQAELKNWSNRLSLKN